MEKSSIDQEKKKIIRIIITVTDCTGRSILYIIYMPLSSHALCPYNCSNFACI